MGQGLLGNFLFLLGKNLCIAKELFVFLQHETDDEVTLIMFLLLLNRNIYFKNIPL